MKNNQKIKRKISGITLLEVLITVLVIAIGMLGMAALQLKTVNTTQESYSRTQAMSILQDVSSRIRVNSDYINGLDGTTNTYTSDKATRRFDKWCDFSGGATHTDGDYCSSGNCNGSDLANYDRDFACRSLFSSGLNEAKMGVACFDRDTGDSDNCSVGSKFMMYVAWKVVGRNDSGDQVISQTRCQKPPLRLDDGYSCSVVEMIP